MGGKSITESGEKYQPVTVVVRCRPQTEQEINSKTAVCLSCLCEKKEIVVKTDYSAGSIQQNRTYYYDKVFDKTSKQIDIYRSVVSPLIYEVLQGYNCTVFAYGQTGTGKTFTMEGERTAGTVLWDQDPLCGVIPRAVHQLFDMLHRSDDPNYCEFSVRVSYLEIYNEEIFDLLSQKTDVCTKLRIFEDSSKKGSVIIHGLEEVVVTEKSQVFSILEKGAFRRQTAATLMNAHSSRSHAVFSITVMMRESRIDGESILKTGKMYLVDLAGSENIGRSGAVSMNAREAGSINQSLLTLGRVITCLAEKRPHIPYRESKLTRLLKDSLGGRTKTCIIATISPSTVDLEETLSTLDYAKRAKSVKNCPEQNMKLSHREVVKEYMYKIDQLKRDLTAARDKEGIYLSSETYDELQSSVTTQRAAILEYEDRLSALNSELEKINELFDNTKRDLINRVDELSDAKKWISTTTDIIMDCHMKLKQKSNELAESQFVSDKLRSSRLLLHEFSEYLLQFSRGLTQDLGVSLEKLDQFRQQDAERFCHLNEFGQSIQQTSQNHSAISNELSSQLATCIDEVINTFDRTVNASNDHVSNTNENLSAEFSVLSQLQNESENLIKTSDKSIKTNILLQKQSISSTKEAVGNYLREYCDNNLKELSDMATRLESTESDLSKFSQLQEVGISEVVQCLHTGQKIRTNCVDHLKESSKNFVDSQISSISNKYAQFTRFMDDYQKNLENVTTEIIRTVSSTMNKWNKEQNSLLSDWSLQNQDEYNGVLSSINETGDNFLSNVNQMDEELNQHQDSITLLLQKHNSSLLEHCDRSKKNLSSHGKKLSHIRRETGKIEKTINQFVSELQGEMLNHSDEMNSCLDKMIKGIDEKLDIQRKKFVDISIFNTEVKTGIERDLKEISSYFKNSLEQYREKMLLNISSCDQLVNEVVDRYCNDLLSSVKPIPPVGNTPVRKTTSSIPAVPTPLREPDQFASEFRINAQKRAKPFHETPAMNRKVVSKLAHISTDVRVPPFDLEESPSKSNLISNTDQPKKSVDSHFNNKENKESQRNSV